MEEKDILQINVTIIAGAFIFLSLSLALVDNLRSTTGSNQTFITLVDKTETKVNLLASLRTTIPMNMVRQWNLKPGSKLDWSWEVVNGEMVIVVRGKES